jgi:putative spermidine/putrescine transport system substrate-binding protein
MTEDVRQTSSGLNRRRFLGGAAGVATAAVGGPLVWTGRAKAAGKVVVRTIGGSYEEAVTKAHYEPFTKATEIEVIKVPANLGKLLAMVEAGNIEVDLLDIGEIGALQLSRKGVLEPLDYKSWKLTNIEDIDREVVRRDMVGHIQHSTVLGYSTEVFPTGKHPRNWVDFWDIKKFPGPRALGDFAPTGTGQLEFPLLADGLPIDKLYPIDMDRAFKSLDRIRPSIRKFWNSGALAAQMLVDREVVMGSVYNGRLQTVADKGAPLAIEWNQGLLELNFWAVLKGAKNRENALRLMEFAMQPKNQADLAQYIPYGPTNRQAFKYISIDTAKRLPSHSENKSKQVVMNASWWADNASTVSERWSKWLLQKN